MLSIIYASSAEIEKHLGHLGLMVNLILSLPLSLLSIYSTNINWASTVLGVRDSIVKKRDIGLFFLRSMWERERRYSDIRLKDTAIYKFISTIRDTCISQGPTRKRETTMSMYSREN